MATEASGRRRGYTFGDVFRFAAGYWLRQPKRFAAILILFVVGAFIETNLPNALSALFEAIRTRGTEAQILSRLEIFIAAYFGYAILYSLTWRIYNVFEVTTFTRVLNDAFEHVESLSEQFFVSTFTGSIITTIKRGRDRIETFEDQIILEIFPTFLVVIYSIALLAMRLPILAILLSAYLLVLVVVGATLVLHYAGPAQEQYANAQDRFGAHLADSIVGMVTTKSHAQEAREIERYRKVTAFLHDKNLQSYLRGNTASMTQRILLGGMLALLLGGGTRCFLQARATVDDMAYLVLAYTILQSHIHRVGDNIRNLLTSSYDLHAIMALLAEKPSVEDKHGAKELHVTAGGISFENVKFTYPAKSSTVFDDLTISIQPGERVALVGHSGSGKTTLVRLLQRLYDVQQGSVSIDGQNIMEVTQTSLRSAIAVVPQDPILFHRTIRENIAYGRPDASEEEVIVAAKQASIHDFIMTLPKQYETLVGERGIKLSGGERQRVAIARAILSNRKILILDEATSSLDSASERAVQDAIYAVTHGRTAVMIAHRLSTIRDADRILVFDEGKIVEEGTHQELLAKPDGIYAAFHEIQSGGFIGVEPDDEPAFALEETAVTLE